MGAGIATPLPLTLHEGCTTAGEPGCPSRLSSASLLVMYHGKGGDSGEQTPCAFSKSLGYLAREEGETGYSTTGKDHARAQHLSLHRTSVHPAPAAGGMLTGCSHLALQGTFTPSPTT